MTVACIVLCGKTFDMKSDDGVELGDFLEDSAGVLEGDRTKSGMLALEIV